MGVPLLGVPGISRDEYGFAVLFILSSCHGSSVMNCFMNMFCLSSYI